MYTDWSSIADEEEVEDSQKKNSRGFEIVFSTNLAQQPIKFTDTKSTVDLIQELHLLGHSGGTTLSRHWTHMQRKIDAENKTK